MGNIWIFDGVSIVPCPKCGGVLRTGEEWDTDPEWGGNRQCSIISCKNCGRFWNDEDMEEGTEPNLYDDQGNLLGWDLEGYWVNGCEGPIKPLSDGTFLTPSTVRDY